jgi:5-methylcytosine-specific restriction enzyme subunit McrC
MNLQSSRPIWKSLQKAPTDMHFIDLLEWQTVRTVEAGLPMNAIPEFDKNAQQAITALNRTNRLEILQLRSGIQLRANSWVGRVTIGDLTITIHPKLKGAPLVGLLRYAYSLRDLEAYSPTTADAEHAAFQDVLIAQLVEEVTELVSRGIHRDYLRFDAALSNPSGRIDFSRIANSVANANASLPCVYHNRSDAILLNKVLLAGLRLAARVATDIAVTRRASALAQILEPSVPFIRLTNGEIDAARRLVDRRTVAYESALTLIQMLLNGLGVSLGDHRESFQIPGFLFDMNVFFQRLISRFLRDELPGYIVQDEHRLKHVFEYDPFNNPRHRRATIPRPDFAVLSNGIVAEFLDAKYRDLWENDLPREMLYQLTVYALSKKDGALRSTIIFPTLNNFAVDQKILLKDPVSGHKNAEVIMRPLNLLELETLVRPRQGVAAARRRRNLAHNLAFGTIDPEFRAAHHFAPRLS